MGFGGGVEQFAGHRREERVLRQRERASAKALGWEHVYGMGSQGGQ